MYIGQDVIDVGLPHTGERYVFGSRADLQNPEFKGPWDCAEFTSWCAYRAYKIMFGMSYYDPKWPDPYSGAWYSEAKAAGTLISVEQAAATPGAALIRLSTGSNPIGHVAFSRGDGTTLEARGSSYGVGSWNIFNPGRIWHTGALIPGIEYTQNAPITPPAPQSGYLRLTSPYMRGPTVEKLQRTLRRRSFHPGEIDGVFGPQTELAVINFQLYKGLTPDGIVGPETKGALGLT